MNSVDSGSDGEIKLISGTKRTIASTWQSTIQVMIEYLNPNNSAKFSIPLNHLATPEIWFKQPTKGLPLSYSIDFIEVDGNCLFRAIALWKYGDQQNHYQIRDFMRHYAITHTEWMQGVIGSDQNLNHWIERMGRDWGCNDAMEVIARGCNIILFVVSYYSSSTPPGLNIFYPDHRIKNNVTKKTNVYFILHMGNHFEIINPLPNIVVPAQ